MNRLKGPRVTRPSVDPGQIVHAAIEILSAMGLEGLAMRRLAAELGVRAASLYWHVRDKAELIQLLADEICRKVELANPANPWQERIVSTSSSYRAALRSVRDAPRIMLEAPPSTVERLRLIEAMLQVFVDAGFSPNEAGMAGALLNNYVIAFVMDEQYYAAHSKRELGDVSTSMTTIVQDSPPEFYPIFRRIVASPRDRDPDEEFEFGIRVLISGFEKWAGKRPPSGNGSPAH